MRDIAHNIAVRSAIAAAVQSAAVDGTAIDTQGFGSVAFVINTGAIVGSGDFGVKIQDSDDGSSFADVAADHVHGTVPATLTASGAFKVGYGGFKRHVRLALTKAGGTSIALGATAVLGNAANRPT
jgi:hypothetical protein